MSLQFDWILDSECFKLLFMAYETESKGLIEFNEEICMTSYRTIDESHLSKNGFITEIIMKTQRILKHKLKDDNLNFEIAVVRMNYCIYKTNIKDNFKFIDLWSVQYDGMNKNFEVEFYTLKKVPIKNDQIFVNLNHFLSHDDYLSLIGSDYIETYHLLSEREKIHINYLIVNSLNLSEKISEQIARKDVDTQIKILIEKPICLFSYSFVTNLNQEDNEFHAILFKLEYIYYNNYNHFYKCTFYDNLTLKSFSKIFSAFHFVQLPLDMSSNEFCEYLKNRLPINSILIKNSDRRRKIKNGLVKYFYNWKKQETFNHFDIIENLMTYLK